jgi:hypothetical protein
MRRLPLWPHDDAIEFGLTEIVGEF